MSWLYLQAQAADCSGADCSDGEPSAPSNATPTGKRSCSRANRTAASIISQSGMTCTLSTEPAGVDSWMSSALGFRASPFPSPASGEAQTTNATAGLTPSGSFAKWDRHSHGWKTCLDLFPAHTSELFSGTWPKQGSMRNGACSALTTLAPRIDASGSGFWPTPRKEERSQRNSQDNGVALSRAVRNWPTPDAQAMNLNADPEKHAARLERLREKHKNGNGAGLTLGVAVRMFPTPASRDWKNDGNAPSAQRRKSPCLPDCVTVMAGGTATPPLNPTWVCWLMGWPLGWTAMEPINSRSFRAWLRMFATALTDSPHSETDRCQPAQRQHSATSSAELERDS